MNYDNPGQMKFFSELSEHQISAKEFFSTVLLDSLAQNFGLKSVLISYFDTKGRFLSWTSAQGVLLDSDTHPYRPYCAGDEIRRRIYQDAVRDGLTYFNTAPRLYSSTALIDAAHYDTSTHAVFLDNVFGAHYSVTMAFGINGYIQVAFFKTRAEGDFTDTENALLREIYVYVADSYKKFKKYEQAKIVKDIQDEVISLGEKAYLVTDDFMHVLSYNRAAEQCLEEIMGPAVSTQLDGGSHCSWLPFLLGTDADTAAGKPVQTRIIQNYVFKIYTYDQQYSNRIVDRYHWITIAARDVSPAPLAEYRFETSALTPTENKVAGLLYKGMTYKDIAAELFVSYHTVKKHVENIYAKCGVCSRYALAKWMDANKK